jgi:organic radical activating enzyme
MNKEFDLIKYREDILDTKSTSFCGAKWYNATTWLGSGTTASCHHPPAHKIPLEEIAVDPSAIHNTRHKKAMRKMMQRGERPRECEYCWKVEDMGTDAISDRVYKSIIYSEKDLQSAYEMDHNESVDLKTFEIAFDRTCQLACSYCNSSFSTTWAKDITANGAYQNMVSDGAGAFQHDGAWAEPYGRKEENPYVTAFWDWWHDGLSDSLEELRVTGGEPLMSDQVWKLFDWFESNDSKMRFAVNSNLMAKDSLIDKLIAKSQNITDFHLYTSCEATGLQADYIRDGLHYETWKNNMYKILTHGKLGGANIMMTINSLCLFTITDFLDDVYDMKIHTGTKAPVVSVNLLRFPSFQSPLALPDHIKDFCRANLEDWWRDNKEKPLWHDFEKASIERLIDYLVTVDAPHRRTSDKAALYRDFKTFFKQYDERRGLTLDVFPDILTEWVDSIPETVTIPLKNLIDGDSTRQYADDPDLKKVADEEGWILNPDNKNIDKPLATYDED